MIIQRYLQKTHLEFFLMKGRTAKFEQLPKMQMAFLVFCHWLQNYAHLGFNTNQVDIELLLILRLGNLIYFKHWLRCASLQITSILFRLSSLVWDRRHSLLLSILITFGTIPVMAIILAVLTIKHCYQDFLCLLGLITEVYRAEAPRMFASIHITHCSAWQAHGQSQLRSYLPNQLESRTLHLLTLHT